MEADEPGKLCMMIPQVKARFEPTYTTASSCFVSVPVPCEKEPCEYLRTTIPCDEYKKDN